MQINKKCIDCNRNFYAKRQRSIRCKKCQIKYRQKKKLEHQRLTQAKSARRTKETWSYSKMIQGCSYDEMRVEILKCKRELKHLCPHRSKKDKKKKPNYQNAETLRKIQDERTKIRIICDIYKMKRQENLLEDMESKHAGYFEDAARAEVVRLGVSDDGTPAYNIEGIMNEQVGVDDRDLFGRPIKKRRTEEYGIDEYEYDDVN